MLVLLDRVEADLADVVDRGPEAHGLGDRLRSGFELRGTSPQLVSSNRTRLIMWPPRLKGSISCRSFQPAP